MGVRPRCVPLSSAHAHVFSSPAGYRCTKVLRLPWVTKPSFPLHSCIEFPIGRLHFAAARRAPSAFIHMAQNSRLKIAMIVFGLVLPIGAMAQSDGGSSLGDLARSLRTKKIV